eukprot:m.108963 g.108963  ORF g.108963 m.108963 type:complete len:50 (+) comp10681_c3_seq1:522-671(+)
MLNDQGLRVGIYASTYCTTDTTEPTLVVGRHVAVTFTSITTNGVTSILQ